MGQGVPSQTHYHHRALVCRRHDGPHPENYSPETFPKMGRSISIVNKPGGSGTIGALEVVKSTPDGYTIMADCNGTSSIQYAWSENLPYKVEERTYMVRGILTPGSWPSAPTPPGKRWMT